MDTDIFSLRGRNIVVTGAAEGLGRTFALAFARRGAFVACVDIDPAVEETCALIEKNGGKALPLMADVSNEAAVTTMAAQLEASADTLHVLVNNAGIAIPPGRLLDVSVANWDRVIATNLRSVFLCSKALLPMLLRSKDASIINLSSFLALVGLYPGFEITAIPYASSKAGVDGFTRQLAIEYARDGLRVNAIAPGWHGGTRLGRERQASSEPAVIKRFNDFIQGSIPMGHMGTPDDLTGLAVYLASSASRYVTGQTFAHDGGLTAA
ncbi:SDR family NAD(P)-dependent oxidoreductase [Roseiarcaceae bacterium H3SJ34-1]|uniref:SDR family NAD(P)-dependent oxidoreductase n=1 Tax=Terripilifer ovatus TaxID=3032367 RepID=UPI003AB9534C|nr:SDR family NAD(P)-dependent oxidoreductase [Roseiarcaceae bacterium H3SJ34-1]